MMKNRIENLFKDRCSHLKEQIDILHKLLVSKEEDLKSKENQHNLLLEIHKERERKVTNQLISIEHQWREAQQQTRDCEVRVFQLEKASNELASKYEMERKRSMWLEERLKIKDENIQHLQTQSREIEVVKIERDQYARMLSELEHHNQQLQEQIELQSDTERATHITRTFLEDSDIDTNAVSSLVLELDALLNQSTNESLEGSIGSSELDPFEMRIRYMQQLLTAKEDVIQRYQKKIEELKESLVERDTMSECTSPRSTTYHDQSIIEHMSNQLQMKEEQIEQLEKRLSKLSDKMVQKEQTINDLFLSVHTAEIEMEKKDYQCTELNDKLMEYKIRVQQKEQELQELQLKSARMEESIDESDYLVLNLSTLCREKEATLKTKTEMVMHFEDLIKQTDEKIRLSEEQVATVFEGMSIIDDYA
eukprot:TRINITY_DN5235_c0_g1_i1.p1 TRINITY_DN5235_c0_g1~~TRINITY_DN5235_c0_g1_i1.p1  ORF type:complete len:422 (-),score=99.75 TRINITY_DN5235_c0_g1_i1:34-1299(-)